MFTADRAKKVLGISVGERSLLVAQLRIGSDAARPQVARVAQFTYPAGATLDTAEALGNALADFLRAEGFTARRAVMGVPARWLVLRTHRIPPADEPTAADLLRLQVESQNPPELGEIVYDFSAQCRPDQPCDALLMGCPRRRLDALLAVAGAARLKIDAVMPCVAALSVAVAGVNGARSLVLSLGPEGAEFAAAHGGRPRVLRPLGAGLATAPLGTELRRVTAMLPAEVLSDNGHYPFSNDAQPALPRLTVWDDVGLDSSALASLEAALGFSVARGDLPMLGARGATNGSVDRQPGGRAVALGLAALSGARPPIDFLHPRLVAPKPSRFDRRKLWISAAAVVVVATVGLGYADLAHLQHQVDSVDADLRQLQPALQTAQPYVARMRFAEAFRSTEPRCLECLRDVTAALPPDGRTYLTGFHLQTSMSGEFDGHSDNVASVMSVIERLSTGGRFLELRRTFDSRGTTPGVSFKVTFVYVPKPARRL